MCDDVHEEARKLKAKGVELTRPISEEAFGLVTAIALPGGIGARPLPADFTRARCSQELGGPVVERGQRRAKVFRFSPRTRALR